MPKLSSLDLWRLAEEVSVVDAAILIAGGDPSEHAFDSDGERAKLTWQHDGFEAAFAALRGSIKANKLTANLALQARGRQTVSYADDYFDEVDFGPEEQKATFDLLVSRQEDTGGYGYPKSLGKTRLNFSVEDIKYEANLFIWKEPNWDQSTIEVSVLKDWLSERGVHPDFFFPTGNQNSFANADNARYSAKLACAVAAWEAISKPGRGKSVKKTLQDWVQSNGVRFGLGEDGVVSPTAAEEIAKIANWNLKGGANPTPEGMMEQAESAKPEPDNYSHEHLPKDPEIPF